MKENNIPESFENAMNDLVVGRVVPLNTALTENPFSDDWKELHDMQQKLVLSYTLENEKLKKEVKMLEKLIELNMNDFWDMSDQRDWYYEECQKLKNRLTD